MHLFSVQFFQKLSWEVGLVIECNQQQDNHIPLIKSSVAYAIWPFRDKCECLASNKYPHEENALSTQQLEYLTGLEQYLKKEKQ